MGSEAKIDKNVAKEAQKIIYPLVTSWLTNLLDYPGFRQWKNQSLLRHIFFSVSPDSDLEHFHDFEFDKNTLAQHNIVSLYMNLQHIYYPLNDEQVFFAVSSQEKWS